MSGKATGRVWELKLPHSEQLVLLALADHSDHNGANIFPGMRLVAWQCGYSERQVRRVLSDIIRKGYLVLDAENYGKFGTNCYHINWSAIPKKEAYEYQSTGRPSEPKAPPIAENLHDKMSNVHDKMSLALWDIGEDVHDKMSPTLPSADENLHDILSKPHDILSDVHDIAVSYNPSINPSLIKPVLTNASHLVEDDTKKKKPTSLPPDKKPTPPTLQWPAGFRLTTLWEIIKAEQGYAPVWNYGVEIKAVNAIVTRHPEVTEQQLAAFLAYKSKCWRADPTAQVKFSVTQSDFDGWYASGMPADPNAVRSKTNGQTNGRGLYGRDRPQPQEQAAESPKRPAGFANLKRVSNV